MKFSGIDTTKYGEDETLFFIRIKGKEHFFEKVYGKRVMERLFGHIRSPHTISEYRNADHYIDLTRYQAPDLTPEDYELYYACIHSDLDSIISRCRGLRAIPLLDAKLLILSTCKFFAEFFKSNPYRLVVIHIIDNYVLDVMYRVATQRGIAVLVLSEWLVEHYRRHTIYGELAFFRDPPEAEVLEVEKYFLRNEKNYWLRGMDRVNRIRYALYLQIRYWILYWVRFLIRYKLLGNPAYEYRFANVWKIKPSYLFVGKYFDTLTPEFVDSNADNLMVLPLHTYPEANVDYWLIDSRHADYYTSLFEVASFFRSRGITLLVKEHPGFLYQRDPWVYKQLKRFDNVRLVDPMSPSSKLLDRVPTVLVWHGSMGIEALIRGKKVVAFDSNYYSTGLIPSYREFARAAPLGEAERRAFIKRLLSGVQEV